MRNLCRALVLVSALISLGATLELKSGQKVEGEYAGGTDTEVRMRVGSQTLRFPTRDVRSLIFDQGPAEVSKDNPQRRALDVLRAVQSATMAGVNYREYSARVFDAKIALDRELRSWPPSESLGAKERLGWAMELYLIVSSAWNASLTKKAYEAPESVAVLCPYWAGLKRVMVERNPELAKYERRVDPSEFKYLWSCASERMAEAESALR